MEPTPIYKSRPTEMIGRHPISYDNRVIGIWIASKPLELCVQKLSHPIGAINIPLFKKKIE